MPQPMLACSEILKPCGADSQCCGPERIVQQQPMAAPVAPVAPTPAPVPAAAPVPPKPPPPPAPTAPSPPPPTLVQTPAVNASPPAAQAPVLKEPSPVVSGGFLEAKKGLSDGGGNQVEGGWGPGGPKEDVVLITDKSGFQSQVEPEPEMQGEPSVEYDARRETMKMLGVFTLVIVVVFGYVALVLLLKQDFTEPVCEEDVNYKSCGPCGSGPILLPLGGEWEKSWSEKARAPVYFIGLIWCFLGVAIVCDQFMAAIEEITSKEKVVWLRVHGGAKHKFHLKVWNDTVANLTLMALGSSAPEILLSCIELTGNSFFAGELGPSTIVGSAAFNLLVITAVCISAIPSGETRKIAMTSVFMVTASLSLWAYIWLLVILQYNTADRVDLIEAIATFLMFPFLVALAFAADRGWLDKVARCGKSSACPEGEMQKRVSEEQMKLSALYGKSISFDAARLMLAVQQGEKHGVRITRAQHRQNVMKSIFGEKQSGVQFGFKEKSHVVLECAGTVPVTVQANKLPGYTMQMQYRTSDGDAKAGERYCHIEGILRFEPNETEKIINVPIVDDNTGSAHKVTFYVELSDLKMVKPTGPEAVSADKFKLNRFRTSIVIVDDDDAGKLVFSVDESLVQPGVDRVQIVVNRENGLCGDIEVHYETQDGTAKNGVDYTSVEGQLKFADGVDKGVIDIPIIIGSSGEEERRFRMTLSEPTNGARFDPDTDGGEERAICEIILGNPAKQKSWCARHCSAQALASGWEEYKQQFPAALYLGGDAETQSQATLKDFVFHAIALFWKFIFAFVPPPSIAGGWACFGIALAFIGGVTAVIGDMAGLLGCCMGLPDDVTAITLVALGTSLPDTLASKTAAQQDETADNSVGNVTGSNSVNVFLGLGLPWTIGAFYWHQMGVTTEWREKDYKGDTFENLFLSTYPEGGMMVPAGSLGFSVTVFVATATTCLILLAVRRKLYGGELGGPGLASKRDSFILVLLWFVYIIASVWKSVSSKSD